MSNLLIKEDQRKNCSLSLPIAIGTGEAIPSKENFKWGRTKDE